MGWPSCIRPRVLSRSRNLCPVSACLFVTALLVHIGSCAAEDWPQWRGPGGIGVWSERGLAERFPASGLKVLWRDEVGPGWSSPVVAGGRVYVTDARLNAPAARERIRCLDATSGNPLWAFSYDVKYPDYAFNPSPGMGPVATPVVEGNHVYLVGAVGHLHCLNAVTGEVVWKRRLDTEYQVAPMSLNASPLVEGDLLILQVGGKAGACVVAFDKRNGKEAWRALDEAATNSSPFVLTAAGIRQLVVWTQESVTALNPSSGRTFWRVAVRTSRDQAVSTPVGDGDLLLVGGLMLNLQANPPAAAVLWPQSKAASGRILSNTSTPLLRDGYVYSARSTGQLVCLEAGTGKQLWETDQVTDLRGGASIHLTPGGGAVFLYTDRGDLIRARLTPEGYRELDRAHLLEPTSPFGGRKLAWPPPAFADRHVFARSDQELVCASMAAQP